MRIVVISDRHNSKYSNLSSKYILEDFKAINFNNKDKYLKHIEIENTSNGDREWRLFGILTNKEKVLPESDLVIDLTHHQDRVHRHYIKRAKIYSLFEANMDRLSQKSLLDQLNINVSPHVMVNKDNDKYTVFKKTLLPIVVKSANNYIPTFIAKTHEEMFDYIEDNDHRDKFFLENYIRGTVYTCLFIRNFRGQDIYSTSIFEHQKSSIGSEYKIAKYMSDNIKQEIKDIGKKVLSVLDANILEINFIINNISKKIIVNNCILTPKYFPGSPFYEICKSHGINMLELAQNFREK